MCRFAIPTIALALLLLALPAEAVTREAAPWRLATAGDPDPFPDCNGNGIPDGADIAEGTSQDCNENGIPDECEIAEGTEEDCNENGIPDGCDIADGTSADANENGIPDECELRRNVVILFLDDVGPDQLSIYDAINPYEGTADPAIDRLYVQAPNLLALAENGVTFLNAYSLPVCSPARASLLTGVYPERHGVGTVVRHDTAGAPPASLAEFGDPGFEHQTLAQLAQSGGYRAGVIGKWHLALPTFEMDSMEGDAAWMGWDHIPSRGHWDDYRCTFRNLNSTPYPDNGLVRGYYNFFWNDNGVLHERTGDYATTVQLQAALDFCNATPEPFVAYVATNACHSPYDEFPPAHLVNTPYYLEAPFSTFKAHCAMLEALDTEIGRFLDGLDPGVRSRTVFIVMSDNGLDGGVLRSARDDHGLDLGPTYDFLLAQPGALGRFKNTAFERGIKVPLIVSGPGIDQPGRASRALVDVVDVYSTVADILGVAPGEVDGISFLPVLEDAGVSIAEHARQYTFAESFEGNGLPGQATKGRRIAYAKRLADGRRFKLHRRFELAGGTLKDALYQLEDSDGADVDPFEMHSLGIEPGAEHFDVYVELALALCPPMQENYCTATPNSTGSPALMRAEGSLSVSANDLLLLAQSCPPGEPGLFLYGRHEVELPFGNGTLCVANGHFATPRLPHALIDSEGTLSWQLDHGALPHSAGPISAGSTWKFQAWFRDSAAAGAAFDLSDALSITFAP